jgi:alanine racemase
MLEKATDKFLLANNLVKGYNKNIVSHVSASGGFLQGVYMDMVRIGIMLYGYTPYPCDFSLKPVMKVYSPVVKNGRAVAGQSLLYGDKLIDSDREYSIIRYGYADGLERRQNQTILNNRCMDLSAVSQTKKEWYPVMVNADKTASQYGTISYEVLTKCAVRCHKIYT